VRKADNLPPSCAVVTKSGNLNFMEPSGPVQACNGTALCYFVLDVYTRSCQNLSTFIGLGIPYREYILDHNMNENRVPHDATRKIYQRCFARSQNCEK